MRERERETIIKVEEALFKKNKNRSLRRIHVHVQTKYSKCLHIMR